MELREFFTWIVSGGGAGIVVWWAINVLSDKTPIGQWSAEHKRYLAFAASALLGGLIFWASVSMGYESFPETVRGWIEQIFLYASLAAGVSQVIHARVELRSSHR